MSAPETNPERSEVIPIWQEYSYARWLVAVASEHDEQNPWSGWLDIDADARTGLVEACGVEFTADEARVAARALMAAADHVEMFVDRATAPLFELVCPGGWPEIDHLPPETQAMIRDAVHAASRRIRARHFPRFERTE